MNNRFFKLGALLVVLMLFAAFNTFAQLSTVYVDVTNGSNTYTGANPTNNPAGTGPKGTINGGLGAVANNGTIVIMAGSYNGGDNAGGVVDISTANYSALVAGGSLTLQFQTLLSNNQVLLSAGNFTYEVSGGTLNIVTTNGTEYFTLGAGAATLTLGNGTMNSTMGIPTNTFFQIPSGTTIVMNGSSTFSNQAPKAGANVNLTYNGSGSFTAGPESNYGSYGTGSLSIAKTAGTTLTMANAISAIGGITVTSGNVTFSGNMTIGASAVTNNGTGTATFNAATSFSFTDGVASTNIGQVVNTSTGSIVVNGTATWTAGTLTASRAFPAGAGTYLADNRSTGTINFAAPVTLNNSQASAYQITVAANNAAAGTLTFGVLSAPTAGAGSTNVTLTVQNTAAGGTLNLAGGTILGALSNSNATATTNVTGALTVTGIVTNTGTIALGGNTLTLNGAVTHATTGGTITATTGGNVVASKAGATFNGGTFPALNVTGSTVTISGAATIASLNVSGALQIADAITVTVSGTVTETGNISLGTGTSGTLAIKGDLVRTSGTWTAGAGSTVNINGTVAQNLNGGPNFQVVGLTFSNTAAVVTLGASIRASGAVTINSGVNVALNTLNIILNATTASMTNNGTYTATGGGGVILGGTNLVVGGVSGTGITIGGTGLYSYITCDVGATFTATLSSAVKFTGVLTLRSGTLATSTYDLSPNGTSASVVRWVQSATALNTTGGTFDAAAVDYDLTYTETLTGTASVAAGASEFATGNVRNLTVSSSAFTLTLTSGVAVTVKGNMTLSTAAQFVLDATTPYNLTVKGALTVNGGAVTNLSGGNSANTITLSGDGQAHTVLGTISCASILTETGNGASLTGSTVTADAATINNIDFEPTANSASFTSTNLKSISAGPVAVENVAATTATGVTASIAMNTTSASLTGNINIGGATSTPAPTVTVTINGSTTSTHTGNITVTSGTLTYTRGGASTTLTGTVTVAGGTLALGSNVTVTSTTSQTGNLNLNAFNYTAQGAYTHAGSGTVTGTGTFVIGYGASAAFTLTTTVSIPNVQLKAGAVANVVTLTTNNLTVSNSLILTKGTFDFNALNVNFTGSTITTNVGTASDVVLQATGASGTLNIGNGTSGNATWTSNDAVTMPAGTTLVLNSAGVVTFQSDQETASTPVKRTWTLVNFTYTAATGFVTGIDDIAITGAFDRSSANAGTWTQGTGFLYFNTTTAFKPGTGFSIANLEVDKGVSSNTVASDVMTVTNYLRLTSTTPGVLTMNAGKLTLGNGCTVERQADGAKLSSIPTFAGTVSVVYSTTAGITTAGNFNELPATVTNFSVLTPATVTLPANVTVTGSLTLSAALTTTVSTPNVTMANGSTLVLKANGSTVLPTQNLILAGTLNITYDGATSTSTRELGAITSGVHTVVAGNIKVNSATVALDAALTVGGQLTFTGGTLDMGGFALTVQSDVIQSNTAGFITNSGAAAALTFGGATNSALTLKQKWSLPSSAVQFTMNKAAANNTVTLSGGDLDFATNSVGGGATINLTLTQGQLITGSQNVILFQNYTGSNQPVQGFSGASQNGYVVGQVKKFISTVSAFGPAISVVTFPVGTPTPSNYRPLSIYFKSTPQSAINVTVSHMDVKAGGQNGFPISFVNGSNQTIKITNYPAYFWYVKSDISLDPSYQYDLEAQAQGYTGYTGDQIQNVRLVRRDSGNVLNPWILQQNYLTNTALYDNSTIAANWPVVKVINATGGITAQGSIFSYSQNNKAPSWTAAPTNLAQKEGDTVKVNFTATDPDFGDFPTISATTLPTGATFTVTTAAGANPATGQLMWVIPYTVATRANPTATATVTIHSVDSYGPLSQDTTITITVTNVNRPPVFNPRTSAVTIRDIDTLKVTLAATDPDSDPLTYSLIGINPAPANAPTVTGASLMWVPTFTDVAKTFTIQSLVSDGVTSGLGPTPGTDTMTVTVTVNRSRARGDVDGNGAVQAADASYVLKYVAGLSTTPVDFTNPDVLYAADASKNGVVTAYDAALILQAVAGLITLPASADAHLEKVAAVAGTLSLSAPQATNDPNVVSVNLNLADAANVYSAQISSVSDFSMATVEAVNAKLPDGWQMQWNVVGNELRVAMAGSTPMQSGVAATISIRLKNKESRLNFSTNALLNENSQSLGAVEIAAVPTVYALEQNYPNPFNPSTTIRYQIPNDANVNLVIWNLQGQRIRTLIAKEQKAGYYNVVWDGRNDAGQTVSSGFYLYRVQAGSFVAVHKMMLIK